MGEGHGITAILSEALAMTVDM